MKAKHEKKRRWIGIRDGFLGTVMHTSACYGMSLLGSSRKVGIAGILGQRLAKSSDESTQASVGLCAHFFLGSILFPFAYNTVFARILPPKPIGSMIWSLILWQTGQHLVLPALGKDGIFKRHPEARTTYLLAHLLYGATCSSFKK